MGRDGTRPTLPDDLGLEEERPLARTRRLTVGQALVEFLVNQYSERDGTEQRLVQGCFGIFGHGNVAGSGEALLESARRDPAELPYTLVRNEQAMVHSGAAFARMKNRLATLACTTSIGRERRTWSPVPSWRR